MLSLLCDELSSFMKYSIWPQASTFIGFWRNGSWESTFWKFVGKPVPLKGHINHGDKNILIVNQGEWANRTKYFSFNVAQSTGG